MSAELQDLGKQLVINTVGSCWISSLGQTQMTIRGRLDDIERTLVEALEALRNK